ncbi:MAG: 3-deoxy-D-manno-octulosonic acid transferase [Pseudobdellovibrio sp.]
MSFMYLITYTLLRVLILTLNPLLPQKLKQWIELRNSSFDILQQVKLDFSSHRIWIHAASGEIEYAKAVIRELKNIYPNCTILVSYSSPSAPKLFKNIEHLITHFFPLSWDISICNQKLIDIIKPDILIFSRTDFWPNLVKIAYKNNIKLALISFYPSWSFVNTLWYKHILKYFSLITCVDKNSTDSLKKILSQTRVLHIPDTRFDQVLFRLSQPSLINLNTTQKRIVFGSTWPEDESILKSCVDHILEKNYSIIWAPHEVKHSLDLITVLKTKYPNKVILILGEASISALENQEFDFLIVDKIGYLADFYRFSDLSFIGGSFVKRVHSVMEPLCALNPVIVGPYYHNNPEAVLFKEKGFVKSVTSSDEFIQCFDKLLNQTELKEKLSSEISFYKNGSFETARIIKEIIS